MHPDDRPPAVSRDLPVELSVSWRSRVSELSAVWLVPLGIVGVSTGMAFGVPWVFGILRWVIPGAVPVG